MEKEQEQKTTEDNNLSENISENEVTKNQKDQGDDIEEKKEILPEEKIKELEDKLARTFAEMENQRRRFEKEKEDAFEYGGFSLAKEALNLIDNLERSKQVLENDEELKNTKALQKTLEHLKIINKDLISIFNKNHIKPINCLDKKLDPNFHQAMIEIENEEKEPGTIIQEIQKGFTMKDRLLRPSLVGVSKKTEKKKEENHENRENPENKWCLDQLVELNLTLIWRRRESKLWAKLLA